MGDYVGADRSDRQHAGAAAVGTALLKEVCRYAATRDMAHELPTQLVEKPTSPGGVPHAHAFSTVAR